MRGQNVCTDLQGDFVRPFRVLQIQNSVVSITVALHSPVYLSSRNCWNFWPEAILRHGHPWKNSRTQMLDFQVRVSRGCSFLWHYCWKESIAYCSSLFTIIYFVILASPYRCDPEVAGTTRVSKFLFLTWHTSLENWSRQWNPEGKPLPSYFSLFRIWGYWFGFPE